MAYEIIRDSIYIMTAYRSTGEQRVDEILWICSEENQEDLCSFTSCCKIAGLDPFETRMEILHEWSSELAKQARLIACHHFTAPTNMEHVASQRIGYENTEKRFITLILKRLRSRLRINLCNNTNADFGQRFSCHAGD